MLFNSIWCTNNPIVIISDVCFEKKNWIFGIFGQWAYSNIRAYRMELKIPHLYTGLVFVIWPIGREYICTHFPKGVPPPSLGHRGLFLGLVWQKIGFLNNKLFIPSPLDDETLLTNFLHRQKWFQQILTNLMSHLHSHTVKIHFMGLIWSINCIFG